MSASVAVAFACTVLAAVGTGVLAGRCFRAPRMDLVAWTCAGAGLAVALGAQAVGYESGYGSATFRIVQIGAQLVAPLWLAWGMVELTGRGVAVRFGAKLVTAALTFVAAVVLITDPLSSTPFGKSWPAASAHYQIIPRSLLNLVAGVTVATVIIALAVAGARARNDAAWRRPMIVAAVAGAAALVVLGLRFTLPVGSGYALLCAAGAGLAWFAGTRADQIDLDELHEDVRPMAGRRARGRRTAAGEPDPSAGAYQGYDDSADPFADDRWYRPAASRGNGGYQPDGEPGAERGYQPEGGYQPGEGYAGYPGGAGYADAAGQAGSGRYAGDAAYRPNGMHRPDEGYWPDGGDEMNGQYREAFGYGQEVGYGQEERFPPERDWRRDNGTRDAGRTGIWQPRAAGRDAPDAGPGPAAPEAGEEAGLPVPGDEHSPRTYGLIAIYTLAEDRAGEFDALAERVVDKVRTSEPDTLVYAVHTVPNAPMQRIFYQVYRDKGAYEEHCRQPYVRRFETERAPYVLATNLIELGVQQAKLSDLLGRAPQ